jgi:hypothetical protein
MRPNGFESSDRGNGTPSTPAKTSRAHRPHWRSRVNHDVDRDGDGDGVACET